MNQNKLSADPTAMILGIIALVISFAGCCCGLFTIITLAMSIIGLVMSNRSLKEFREHPETYSPQSKGNVSIAKVINIIALVINSIITLIYIAYFVFYGALFSAAIKEGYEQQQSYDDYNYEDYESENDSIDAWEDDVYIIEEEKDSVEVEVEETKSFDEKMKDFNSKY